MANSAEPDQLASSEANWSGSAQFAKAEHIQVQQDKGLRLACWVKISTDDVLNVFKIFFLYFAKKMSFDISCSKLSS